MAKVFALRRITSTWALYKTPSLANAAAILYSLIQSGLNSSALLVSVSDFLLVEEAISP
jgi:hypothetical protein